MIPCHEGLVRYISSMSFFLGSDFGVLMRDDGAIEVALGCGWRTVVADNCYDMPC